jgi:hypothetical protein
MDLDLKCEFLVAAAESGRKRPPSIVPLTGLIRIIRRIIGTTVWRVSLFRKGLGKNPETRSHLPKTQTDYVVVGYSRIWEHKY